MMVTKTPCIPAHLASRQRWCIFIALPGWLRSTRWRLPVLAAFLGPLLVLAAVARAAPEQEEDQQMAARTVVEQWQAEALENQEQRLEADLAALRQRLIAADREADEIAAELATLNQTETRLERRIAAGERDLVTLRTVTSESLIGLLRLSRIPSAKADAVDETAAPALTRFAAPEDRQRAGTLLGTTVQTLHRRTTALRTALADLRHDRSALAARRADRARDRDTLTERMVEIKQRTAELETLLDRTQRAAVATDQRLKTLSVDTAAPRDLIEGLAGSKPTEGPQTDWQRRQRAGARAAVHALATKPTMQPVTASGRLLGRPKLPVLGHIRVAYGETDSLGDRSEGIEIETRPSAVVVAPLPGRIRFAGPFRGYGQLLIVDHGNGYHSLIAGLGRIDRPVGREVMAGEPLGTMASASEGTPSLYFELRRHGTPVDPHPLAMQP